jgi:MoaA/NifB/PqqE/SkfB family radical SAM enzyme
MKIIKVEPATPMIALTWMIGSRCNYACSYCPDELHDDFSPHPDLEKLLQVWNNFYEKTKHIGLPYKISFTGGEVTANKSFLPLIEYLRDGNFNIGQLLVTTNGSASNAYYLRLAKLVDSISFSIHTEFWNESKFFDTVIAVNQVMIRPKKSVHVNIMDEPESRHRFLEFEKILAQHNVSYSINKIEYDRS